MDGKILDILVHIKEAYGDGVFYNHTMINNILNDLAPNYRKERIHIKHFLETNGFFQLKHADKTFPVTRQRLIATYADTYDVDTLVATWTVDLFASLLGYNDIRKGASYAKDLPPPVAKAVTPPPEKPAAPATVIPKAKPAAPASPVLPPPRRQVSRIAADVHSLAVTKDGKVLAAGSNDEGQCNTWWWENIVSVAAGTHFTVGLKNDGTVLATGRNDYGQCNVKHLSDIKQISAGTRHMAALRQDGSVVAIGDNTHGECNVNNWRHIVRVIAGCRSTFGIKKDGRVLVSGHDTQGSLSVSHLSDITDVVHAMPGRAVALNKKGTIDRIGVEDTMNKNFAQWRMLRQISAAPDYIAGLFNNGTVRLLAYFWRDTGIECATNDWRDMIAIAAGRYHILGLRKDGQLQAAMLHPSHEHNCGQCKVGEWKLT